MFGTACDTLFGFLPAFSEMGEVLAVDCNAVTFERESTSARRTLQSINFAGLGIMASSVQTAERMRWLGPLKSAAAALHSTDFLDLDPQN